MSSSKRSRQPGRVRVGRVSVYRHRTSWWIYYRENGRPLRRRVGVDWDEARAVAAQVNAQLCTGQRSLFAFQSVSVAELRRRWLDHHENVLASSLATVTRYRTASGHLVNYAATVPTLGGAHEVNADGFVRYLRALKVAPNGHANAAKRPLRDKGIRFILETCRSLYNFAGRQRLLPPYQENPFAELRIARLAVADAKPIHIFTAEQEAAFLGACDQWQFPMFFILAKQGLRTAELTHLLVENVDLVAGVVHIRNQPELGWKVKTRNARSISLPQPLWGLFRRVVDGRTCGVLLRRRRFAGAERPLLVGMSAAGLTEELDRRAAVAAANTGRALTRSEWASIARGVWRDAGAIKPDEVRQQFLGLTRRIGLPEVTCVKCWRHTLATLMQEANVDPLIRQATLGHVPAGAGRAALGMTAVYTHTQRETHRQQLQRVMELRPESNRILERFLDHRGMPLTGKVV